MGSSYRVRYWPGENTPHTKELHRKLEQTLKELNRQMSTYQKDSEISRFNSDKGLEWKTISSDFYTVLKYSLALAKKTQSAFDPTIGPLVNLWGFGPKGERKVPTSQQIENAKRRVGHQHVELSPKKSAIRKKIPELYLDLSASAKGFAVDRIAHLLEVSGVEHYLVEIGGEVRVKGNREGRSWNVAIETPHPLREGFQKVLKLENHAVATSGDYRNFFRENGKTYSHTLDFHTGRPVKNALANVTVVDSECLKADALATALMAMGLPRAFTFSEKEKIAAYFIYRQGENLVTKASSLFHKHYGGDSW